MRELFVNVGATSTSVAPDRIACLNLGNYQSIINVVNGCMPTITTQTHLQCIDFRGGLTCGQASLALLWPLNPGPDHLLVIATCLSLEAAYVLPPSV